LPFGGVAAGIASVGRWKNAWRAGHEAKTANRNRNED